MDWSLFDKIAMISLIIFFKFWRIIVPAGIVGLIALGYWIGS